jgi:sugar porter (SP) family MFS transporter
MGIFDSKKKTAEVEVAQAEAPQFEHVNWKSNPGLRKLYFYAAVLCIASATTGYDGMLLNTCQNLDGFMVYFGEPTGSRLGLMNAIYQIGSLVSFPFVPPLADRFGRRIPIIIGCILMIIGAFLGAFATNYGMFTGARFILGFGNSLAQLASPVLLTEICHPQHRARVSAIYNCLWNVGALVVAWGAWATMQAHNDWSWRSLTLLQGFPSFIQIVFIYWVPESPRWLIAKERYEEALTILAKYHANGDRDNITVQFEWQEIKETLRLEHAAKKSSYLDFMKTRGNRYRLLLLVAMGVISQYSGNAIISNYSGLLYKSMGIASENQRIPLNGGQTLLSLIVSLVAATLVDRVGRRPLFLISLTGMCAMFLAWTITSSQFEASGETDVKGSGYIQVAWIWLFGVFYSIGWSGLLVAYSLEILPYMLRAKGIMIMNLTVQATLVLGNYTNPIAWENLPHHWNLSLIYTVWIFVELIFVYFMMVETRGPTLEEIAKIFDGEDADVAHIDIHAVEKEVHTGADHISETNSLGEKRVPHTKAQEV